jgi:hypothetical protein
MASARSGVTTQAKSGVVQGGTSAVSSSADAAPMVAKAGIVGAAAKGIGQTERSASGAVEVAGALSSSKGRAELACDGLQFDAQGWTAALLAAPKAMPQACQAGCRCLGDPRLPATSSKV